MLVPPVTDERDELRKYLAAQRNALRSSVFGLTREGATSRPTTSALSLAGIIKHAAYSERGWVAERLAGRDVEIIDYDKQFELEGDSPEWLSMMEDAQSS